MYNTDNVKLSVSEKAEKMTLIPAPIQSNLTPIQYAALQDDLSDQLARLAPNTIRNYQQGAAAFEQFINSSPDYRREFKALGLTAALVMLYRKWLLESGYSVATINARLAAMRFTAGALYRVGRLTHDELLKIRDVKGYARKDAIRIDEKRPQTRHEPTQGAAYAVKKAEHVSLSKEQAVALKTQPNTPQGARDTLLMYILLDHGLRCGEVALLTIGDFIKDGPQWYLNFYRPKVAKQQRHRLTVDTAAALEAYLAIIGEASPDMALLKGSNKHGQLVDGSMSTRAITKRVKVLGADIGIAGLSAHDCRHYWATRAAQKGTSPFALQEAGGWSSLAMPRRYVESAAIANEGVILD